MKHFLFIALAVSLSACSLQKNSPVNGGGGAPPAPTSEKGRGEQAVIENVAQNIVSQTYRDLADNSAKLRDAVVALGANRTQARLDAAQSAWRAARVSWEQTEAFLFGPVEALSIDPMIDTWPLNVPDLDSILASGSAITPETIRSMGTNLKGFHTVEYLLFGKGESTNTKAVGALQDRELEYVSAVAIVLAEDTLRLADAWSNHADPDNAASEAYVTTLSRPGSSNAFYPSHEAVFAELVNGMANIADEVANGKIAEPLGASVEQARPSAEESPFSWNSIADFANNIESIRMVYTGASARGNGEGLMKLVEAKDPALAKEILAQIDLSIAKIKGISGDSGMPFRYAILDLQGRERVKAAQDEVTKLFDMLKLRLVPFFQNQ